MKILVSGSLAKATRATLPQSCRTIRDVTPEGHRLLEVFARSLETEERAHELIDEQTLERGLVADEAWLAELLRREHTGASAERVKLLLACARRDRRLVRELHDLYGGKCQGCGFDSPAVYGVPSAEGHHLVYLSRGGEDSLANVMLLCPTHHAVVHKADAAFDHGRLAFLFPNGWAELPASTGT